MLCGKGLRLLADSTTQMVHICYHYGTKSQKTIPNMVLGMELGPISIIVAYMDPLGEAASDEQKKHVSDEGPRFKTVKA